MIRGAAILPALATGCKGMGQSLVITLAVLRGRDGRATGGTK